MVSYVSSVFVAIAALRIPTQFDLPSYSWDDVIPLLPSSVSADTILKQLNTNLPMEIMSKQGHMAYILGVTARFMTTIIS